MAAVIFASSSVGDFGAFLAPPAKASEPSLDRRSNGPEPNDRIGQRMPDGLAHSLDAFKQVFHRAIYSCEPRPDFGQRLFERLDDLCRFSGSSFPRPQHPLEFSRQIIKVDTVCAKISFDLFPLRAHSSQH